MASLVIESQKILNGFVRKFFKGTKVANMARSPDVWCYSADYFLKTLEQGDPFWTGEVEVFHCVDVLVQGDSFWTGEVQVFHFVDVLVQGDSFSTGRLKSSIVNV